MEGEGDGAGGGDWGRPRAGEVVWALMKGLGRRTRVGEVGWYTSGARAHGRAGVRRA